MKNLLYLVILFASLTVSAQDTTVVQTLTFDSTGRAYNFVFPDGSDEYRKIVMQYRMRCKNGLISNSQNPNQGCGEWDYSCNTFLTDSSRVDSVKATHPDYIISGFNGATYNYTTQPTYTYYSYDQVSTSNSGVISEVTDAIGTGTQLIDNPLSTDRRVSKSQYLITAGELTNITAGNITGLSLDLNALGIDTYFLRIKMKSTNKTSLNDSSNIDLSGFTDVYFLNTSYPVSGLQAFDFNTPFVWDGSSNIIVEISYTNQGTGAVTDVLATDVLSNVTLLSNTDDEYIDIPAGDNLGELSTPLNFGTSQDFSVEMWVKPGQTQNDPAMLSDKNWGSGSNKGFVIFQNGATWRVNIGDGSNRVDITGGNIADDGEWHHIAVTFDRDGLMTLYQDGALVTSTSIAGIGDIFSGNTIKIGQDGTGTYGIDWVGSFDDLRIWNKALTAQEVENWMHRVNMANHPSLGDLLVLNSFNNVSAGTSSDEASLGNDITISSGIANKLFRGKDLFKDFSVSTVRPNFILTQGTYTSSVNTVVTVLDSVQNAANLVTEYGITNNNVTVLSTNAYYASGNMPIYDEQGNATGFVNVPSEGTITISDLNYFEKFPAKIELMSFVTPYGLGLDLGSEGKMWEFDMTDFTTVLRNNKYLTVEFSGAYQEELDVRFLFIEGTPPRDVIDLQHVWKPGVRRAYNPLINDTYFEPRDVSLNPAAQMFKLRTAITGHGQEGEFIPRMHYINVNGGANEVDWQVWKECADNPIYPQGGTWIYDRAGWCPGAATDINQYEVDPNLVSGNTMNVDYGVVTGSGTSEYYISCQLVSYGDFNFQTDAAISKISNPTNRVEHLRINPVCSYPSVEISNTGAQTITSIEIEYAVSGGMTETYTWTGNLEPLKTTDIELPIANSTFWNGDGNNQFNASIVKVNGNDDDYADNNALSSKFEFPDYYGSNFVIELRTNNNANQNSYVIKDLSGNVVHSQGNFANNTTYFDTLNLPVGCYTLELTDTGNDGLSFWANSQQGSGYFRLRKASAPGVLKTFEPDFGSILNYGFTRGEYLFTEELENNTFDVAVFPNPTNDIVYVNIKNIQSNDVVISVLDLQGRKLREIEKSATNNSELNTSIDFSDLSSGKYIIEIQANNSFVHKKIIVN